MTDRVAFHADVKVLDNRYRITTFDVDNQKIGEHTCERDESYAAKTYIDSLKEINPSLTAHWDFT